MVIENWEQSVLIINYNKRFLYEINNISRLNESVIYIITVPGMEEFFHLTIDNLSNTNLIAFRVISIGPRVIGHFLQYLDIHCFYSLRDTSPLLEYAKDIMTKGNDPTGIWYTRNEETPSWALSTVKIILMCPGILLYHPETVWDLVGLMLDRYTFNGEVQDVGPLELKEEIVRRLHQHVDWLRSPDAAFTISKEQLEFEFKLRCSLIIHLNIKSFI